MDALRRHGRLRRRLLPVGVLATVAILAVPGLASADSPSTLTVVGTSDVSDSGLVQNVLQPAFQAAYPQYQFKYIGQASGPAIASAESGSQGASALIVHAPSLENRFVEAGYSQERYGRALFTNDFVLAGPTGDPAGVTPNGTHDAARAFADVAAAGIAGRADFVSRGGTAGTTVQEHGIWQLVNDDNLSPAGLLLCAVSAPNGGGLTPIAAGQGVTASGQACPNNGALPSGASLPAWYQATSLTQGPNVIDANACTNAPSGANSCYVFTDRGTYDYLRSGTDPAGTIPNLTILTRDDSATAPGGRYGLINYFHGYVVNPAKPGESVNVAAARAFLNLITSPAVQARVASYLSTTSDPAGAPFKPDASPLITLTARARLPRHYVAGRRITLRGTVLNGQPGFPAIHEGVVTVDRVVGGIDVPVASRRTNAKGAFAIPVALSATGRYVLSTPQITQLENTTLDPPFGDILQPAATTPVTVTVTAAITHLRVLASGAGATVLGSVAPGAGHVRGVVTLYARRLGVRAHYRRMLTRRIGAADGNFAGELPLPAGRWQLRAGYSDPSVVSTARPRTAVVTVTGAGHDTARLRALRSIRGRLTASVSVTRATTPSKVTLFALRTTNGGRVAFAEVARATVPAGTTTATLHGRLKTTGRYALQLTDQVPGQATSRSSLRTLTVRATA